VAKDFGSPGFGSGYAAAEPSICTLADTVLTGRGQRPRYLGPNGKYFVTLYEGTVHTYLRDNRQCLYTDRVGRLWDAATGKQVAVLRGHKSRVPAAAFSPDGGRLVTASADGTARVWSAR
jgi:WD40 repeat protein